VPRKIFGVIAALVSLAALPTAASANAAAPSATTPIKILSAKANSAGDHVVVRLRWDSALIARAGKADRFRLRVLAHPANGHTTQLGTLVRSAPRSATETVTVRTNAKRLRSSRRVTVTATQQYDTPSDSDARYEQNRVAIRALSGKSSGLSLRPCSLSSIAPGADMSSCDLPGAMLVSADLSGVNFTDANLSGGSLAGAKLVTTNLSGADLVNTSTAGAVWPSSEQGALTLPADGPDIVSAIAKAKNRVDVISYTFGGPDIVGQASKPGALMNAVQRGVDVRLILNSGNKGCASLSPSDQQACVAKTSFDSTFAIKSSLAWAKANPLPSSQGGTGSGGNFEIRSSSQNFQISHQKTILIDALSADGSKPLVSAASLALVSTGNLGSYNWGSSYKNAAYLTNPSAGCGAAGCDDDWSARDFTILVKDQAMLQRIATVYASDAACDTWASSLVYKDLLGTTMADTWANGTLLADGSTYPSMGNAAFYGGDAINPGLQPAPQGNSRARTLALIASASKSLIVYNEEMADPDVMNALVDAKRAGVDVQVVMASAICDKYAKVPCVIGQPVPSASFDYLTAYGVKVTLLNSQQGLYIHAKAIVADGTDGFIGSENFGYGSMNYNRELGLMLTNRFDPSKVASGLPSLRSVEGIAAIESAFAADSDVTSSGGIIYNTAKVYASPPVVQPYPWPLNKPGHAFPGFNVGCGLLPDRPAG